MTAVTKFRNVDFDVEASPDRWPFEAVQTVLERGQLSDWRILAEAIRRNPWGACARAIERITGWGEIYGTDDLLAAVVADARADVVLVRRKRYAAMLRDLRAGTGLTLTEFAREVGTSPATLSRYENAVISPTTDTVGRIEHVASHLATADRRATPMRNRA